MSDITPEVLRRSTPRRVALFVALIVAFFVLINVGARWYLQNHGTNLGYRIVHGKWDLLEEMERPVDWLVFGDSSGAHGIVPEALTEVVGGSTAVNLATLADCLLVDDAWMLERYIERFGPPENVLLVHAYDVWQRGYSSALIGQIPRPWGFWETASPRIDFTPAQERRLFLSRFVPVYAERDTLKAHLEAFGPPRKVPFDMSSTGFVPGRPHEPAVFARDLRRAHAFLSERTRFSVSRLNAEALDVIGALADRHGFPVYLVNGPMAESVARTARFKRYHAQKTARLERMGERHRNLHVISDLTTYPDPQMEVFVDHVIPEMAPVFTRTVGDAIRLHRKDNPPPRPVVAATEPAWPPVVQKTLAPGKREISMVFGGDASLARGITQTIDRFTDGDPGEMLAGMKPWMSGADLAFVNLECVLSDSDDEAANRRWLIRARPDLVRGLTDIGVDIVSVANNHTLDYGRQGYHTTLQTLDAAGLAVTGSMWGNEAPQVPTLVKVGDYTVGFLAYTDITKFETAREGQPDWFWPKPARYAHERVRRDVERARPLVDILVLSLHWGHEYSMLETDTQREQARAFVDAGVDLVIGHHPHVPRVVERYGKGLIAYSLGDFVFDKSTPFKTVRNRRRFALRVEWGPEGLADYRLLPMGSDDQHRPAPQLGLDTDSWRYVEAKTPFAFSENVAALTVDRIAGTREMRCGRRTRNAPQRKGTKGYQKWLRDRWACPDDAGRPWLTVARSAHRADAIFHKGVWAHPTPNGLLRISADVPLGQALEGFAGVPDWPLQLAGEGAPPVRVRVDIDGERVFEQSVPVAPGWTPLRVDTARYAGQTRRVVVEIEGGPDREFGFVFDFKVDPVPVSFN